MAKGKYKTAAATRDAKAEHQELVAKLMSRITELEGENEQLKRQLDHDHSTHAYQMSLIFQDLQEKSSPRVKQLEAEVALLKEHLIKTQKALRGAE